MKSLKITETITNRNSEAFKAYLRDISNIDMFDTPQDEADCATKAVNGDESAKEELIRRNLRFVVSVAKQYQRPDVELEDLVNEGNMGLFEAANRFDPTVGNKFISYAVWYIRKNIHEFLNTNSRTIRVPANRMNNLPRFNNELEGLKQKLGRDININDMFEHLTQYSEAEIRAFMELGNTLTNSLDRPFQTDGDSGNLLDILESPGNKATDEDIVNEQSRAVLDKLLGTLTFNQEMVIRMYFALGFDYERNLDEIGTEMGISRERVRQLKEKGLKHLRITCRKLNVDMAIFG